MAEGRRVAGITAARRSGIEPATAPALAHSALTHLGADGVSASLLIAKSCHRASRTFSCHVRPGTEAVTRLSVEHTHTTRGKPPRRYSLRRSSGSAAGVAQSKTQAMGGHANASGISFGEKTDAYNLTGRICRSQVSPHALSRIPGRIRHPAFKKRSGPRCAPRSAP